MTEVVNHYGTTIASRATPLKPIDPRVFTDAATLGLGWIRLQVQWSHIELTKGAYDAGALAVIDDCVSRCTALGLSVQFPIQEPPAFHLSTTSMGTGPNGPWFAWDAAATAAFVTFLAQRYGSKIAAYEIGNEDFDNRYVAGAPVTVAGQTARDPKWFIPILAACAPVIRQHAPSSLIGLCGLWWEFSPHRTSFMQALYDGGCKDLFDYANFHFYPGSVPPGTDTSPERLSLSGQIDEIWQVMNKNGDGQKQVWVTEFGWAVPTDVDEPTRQKFYQQAFDIARTNGHVGVMNLFTMNYTAIASNPGSVAFSLTHAIPPQYTPTFGTIQQYIKQYPTWGGVTPPPPPPPLPTVITVPLAQFTGTVTAVPPVSLSFGETLTDYTGTVSFTPSSIVPPPPPPLPTMPVLDGISRFVLASAVIPPPPPPTGVPHIMVILLENHSLSQVTGNAAMPNLNAYASTYGFCSDYMANAHPSLPNYLRWISGDGQGVAGDGPPSNPLFAGPTIVDELSAKGIPWAAYFQSIPGAGYTGGDSTSGGGPYVQHHNPFVYFRSVAGTPAMLARVQPMTGLAQEMASSSPSALIWATPDNLHNGHTGTDAQLDSYVGSLVSQVQASPWYTASAGKIILLFDESGKTDSAGIGDDVPGGGHIYCCVISEHNKGMAKLTAGVNHYGFLRALCLAYGVAPLGKAAHITNGDLSPLLQ